MPLSYWANMGLDANRIKEHTKPEDVQWSDQLGWTYRVIIKGSKRTIKKSQREVMTIVSARKRRGVAIDGAQAESYLCRTAACVRETDTCVRETDTKAFLKLVERFVLG